MRMKPVYISGGGEFTPSEIKAELDKLRISMGLDNDIVLFGIPVDELISKESVKSDKIPEKKTVNSNNYQDDSHKIIQFPEIGKKSILNVIANPIELGHSDSIDEISISKTTFELDDSDLDLATEYGESDFEFESDYKTDDDLSGTSITALFNGLPPLLEDQAPTRPSLAQEFGAYLDQEETEPAPKKAKPFGRKKKSAFNNVLGDLFSFAGMAANDDAEEFKLPDFIKRP